MQKAMICFIEGRYVRNDMLHRTIGQEKEITTNNCQLRPKCYKTVKTAFCKSTSHMCGVTVFQVDDMCRF